jgi:hypothetical protein
MMTLLQNGPFSIVEYGGGGRGYSWGSYQEGSGYFGPFLLCAYTPGGWGSACDGSVRFKKEGELKI